MKTIWVFATGMRRSASTLQYHLAKDLVELAGGIGVGFVTWQKLQEVYHKYDGKYPYVVLKSHTFLGSFVMFDNLSLESRAKILHIHRDMRDVAASLLDRNKFTETWEQVIENIPVILNETKQWAYLESDIYISRYEDMITYYQLIERTLEIKKFLQLDFHHPLNVSGHFNMVDIARNHTLESHQELISEQSEEYNKQTLFWKNHIDEGKIGRYKDELTEEQIAEVEKIAGEWLKENNYDLSSRSRGIS